MVNSHGNRVMEHVVDLLPNAKGHLKSTSHMTSISYKNGYLTHAWGRRVTKTLTMIISVGERVSGCQFFFLALG